MANEDVFEGTAAPAAPVVPVLETLVGEGKKFKTPEDLAKGKLEADTFVETLKAENAQLRKEIQDRLANEQTQLAALKQELTELRSSTPSKGATSPALTEDSIRDIVRRSITEEEASRTLTQNVNEANNQVVSRFGSLEKAREAVGTRAAELGLSKEALKAIAAQSPTAFVQLIVGEAKPTETPAASLAKGTVNPQALKLDTGTQGPKQGTWEYYEHIRTTDPKRYYSAGMAQEIFQARKNGMEFPKGPW